MNESRRRSARLFPIGCLCVLVGVLVLARRLGSISNNDDGTRRRIPPFSADTSITDGISTTPNQELLLRDSLQQVQDAGYRVCVPPAEDKDERDTMMGRLVAVPACEDAAAYTASLLSIIPTLRVCLSIIPMLRVCLQHLLQLLTFLRLKETAVLLVETAHFRVGDAIFIGARCVWS